ncbi:MAG: DUF190 domain-containing protein [Alicyclobacillus herbarius]|uniref:DUF190 domain-containing protein n=1 Tax=Alicyclobacillus herbarius TaxID=122960 RepID=UPI000426696F|nr:DUF190 domain-containing protein [Alicyclobacillus herbarius]MCL6632623.1 DUF190 domain-containing protein [Alicyclobacillus herbarius]
MAQVVETATQSGGDDSVCNLIIGLWNGATMAGGVPLYRRLLLDAREHGLAGATVWRGLEGGHARGAFRTVENEVASNELPILLDFVAPSARLTGWLPRAGKLIGEHGVMVMEPSRRTQPNSNLEHGERLGRRVDIYTLERHKQGGRPLYQAVAEFARRRGLLWLSTTRGMCGIGDGGRWHEPGWWLRKDDVPIIITILDAADRVDAHLPELIELVARQGVVVSTVVDWHHP